MAGMGRFDTGELKEFRKKLEKISQPDVEAFVEGCARDLANRLFGMVVKRTPVGVYPKGSGKKGGTLRRGWALGTVRREGNVYKIEITNATAYAAYVEHGHRTIKKKGYGWAPGKLMMTTSENDLRSMAPQVLENRLKKFLEGVLS